MARDHKTKANVHAAVLAFLENDDYAVDEEAPEDGIPEHADLTFPGDTPVLTRIANTGDGSMLVSWSKVAGATSYKLYRGTSKNPTSVRATITGDEEADPPVPPATMYRDSGSNHTHYYFRVKAVTDHGESDYSNERKFMCKVDS